MKIAVTADLHLTSRVRNPERYHAFENILTQLADRNIENLVIAGDLFDASCKDPGEFEMLLKDPKYAGLSLHIIPGNHDPVISEGAFTLTGIHYISRPQLFQFAGDAIFLFLPYQPDTSVGEALAAFPDELVSKSWVLVAHGDYLTSTGLRNAYENGVYMPLSGRDIQLYQPKKVFLGHIHALMDSETVHYPGSPCGLDPTETGIRSFLIYDTASGQVQRLSVETDVIFYQENLTVLPLADEEAYITRVLHSKIAGWNLDDNLKNKARVRIHPGGYSTNREKLSSLIVELFARHNLQLLEPPDMGKVKLSNDVIRAEIASMVQKRILELPLVEGQDEPSRDDLTLSALNQIYRG